MKSKEPAKSKKQAVTLKDLKARKNPKGGLGTNALNTISAATGRVLNCSMPGGAFKA